MTTGVELPQVDLAAIDQRLAKEQRELLKLATRKRKGRAGPDEAAACKLLYYFSRGMITDRDVQEAIMDGMREVAAYVANGTILRQDGRALPINPMMFFNGLDAKASKKNKKSERVALVSVFNAPDEGNGQPAGGPLMTLEDMKHALTQRWTPNDVTDGRRGGEKLPKRAWPKSLQRVEERLIDYVQAKHGVKTREVCRDYVHASFPFIAWHDDANEAVEYPAGW